MHRGNYGPVHDEVHLPQLAVEGTLPAHLDGMYVRTGKCGPCTNNHGHGHSQSTTINIMQLVLLSGHECVHAACCCCSCGMRRGLPVMDPVNAASRLMAGARFLRAVWVWWNHRSCCDGACRAKPSFPTHQGLPLVSRGPGSLHLKP